jgi:tetratricopeptide (TPR) repeat protein
MIGACIHYYYKAENKLIMSHGLMDSQPDSALHVLQLIRNPEFLSKEQHATYCLLYTTALDKNRISLTSDSIIRIAVDFFGKEPDKYQELLIRSRFYLARVYHETDKSEEAMRIYVDIEPKADALCSYDLTGLINSEMGHLFQRQSLYDNAIVHFKKSADCFSKAGDLKNEGYALINVGLNYFNSKQYDTAVIYLQQVRQIAGGIDDASLLSQSLMVLGMIYAKLNKPDAVKLYLSECINIETDEKKLAQVYTSLSEVYLAESHWEMARFYARKALEAGKNIQNIYIQANGYWCLYLIEKDEGDFKQALQYYNEHSNLKDSIVIVENRNNVIAVQEKYNAEQWKNELIRLEARQQKESFVLLLLIFSITILVLVFFLHRSRSRQKILKNRALMIKNEARLKEFLLKRLDVSKEIIALAQQSKMHPDKIHAKLQVLVETLTFDAADREELIATVNEIYNGFSDKLTADYPELTMNDLQLACMIRSGFDSGIMATIMGISFESIYKKRSRLRKKMELTEKVNIEEFLSKI